MKSIVTYLGLAGGRPRDEEDLRCAARLCGAAGAVFSVHDPGGECLPNVYPGCGSRDIRRCGNQRGPGDTPTHGRTVTVDRYE